jgi:hypothetical protein
MRRVHSKRSDLKKSLYSLTTLVPLASNPSAYGLCCLVYLCYEAYLGSFFVGIVLIDVYSISPEERGLPRFSYTKKGVVE